MLNIMLSYVRGEARQLSEETIPRVFDRTAARFSNREAVVSIEQGIRLTWRELAEQVEAVARGLIGLGLAPGDRVGIWSTNSVEWLLLQLAAARNGMVLVNVNPAYRLHELRYVLSASGMRALFLWEEDSRANYLQILEEARAGQELALEHAICFGGSAWKKMVRADASLPAEPEDPYDVVNIQYTSGTTGSPKGVLLMHRNLVNNGLVIADCLRATEEDRICVPVPLYHCFGCVIGTMTWIVTGATFVITGPRFDARATLAAIQNERATMIYGVPAMFIAELEHPDFRSLDFTSLRTGVMAGAPCPTEVMKRVITDMHCPGIVIGYGLTESSPIITMSSVDDPVDTRVTTVGRVRPNTEVKIVSASGEVTPRGEQGELCTRGYLVMKGYDRDLEATRRAVESDGWLHTGDLATMREDGAIRITGRAKDLVIRGGENIYPREVEEFLHAHPKIAEVQVVGVPDLRLGETLAAWVRVRAGESATEDEIRDFCRGRIAHFKVPQYIRFVEEFPMTISGKVQKYRIREFEIRDRQLEAAGNVQTA
jgi:fatty-acyl-CoA synthase